MTTESKDAYVERLITAYVQVRRMQAGHVGFRSSERQRRYFEDAAEKGIEYGLTPEALMQIAVSRFKPYPYPSQLKSPMFWASMSKHVKEAEADIRMALHLQTAALKTLISVGKELAQALTDPSEGFSAVFCFITAAKNGLDGLANFYSKLAYQEYFASRAIYDNIYPELAHHLARFRGVPDGGAT